MRSTPRGYLSRTRSALVATAVAACAAGCLWAQSSAASAADTGAPSGEFSSSLVANLALPASGGLHPSLAAAAPAAGGQYAAGHRSNTVTNLRQKFASNFALDFGGGFNAPHPDSTPDITWGGQFNVGAGYNFSPRLAMLAEYQFIDDKLPGALAAQAGSDGAHAHIWSFTLNPIVSLFPHKANDLYFTGGGGFYRKMTNFTVPADYCDYYGYCESTNQVVGHFSSNQGGVSIGFGYQRHIGNSAYHESRMKIYAEARYLHLFSPAGTYYPSLYLNAVSVNEGTTLIPVNFGVRW